MSKTYTNNSQGYNRGNDASKKARQAQQKLVKKQGPKEIIRIDSADPDRKIQWHAHSKNKGGLNIDGTIHDKNSVDPNSSKKALQWLEEYGWDVDRYLNDKKLR